MVGITRTDSSTNSGNTRLLGGAENLTIATLVRAGRAVGAELKLSFRSAAAHAGATANPASSPVSKVAEDPTPYRVTRKP